MSKAVFASSNDVAVIFTKYSVCFHAPVEIMTRPVMVQMIRVSMYGPSMATAPSRTENFVLAVECAMAADPCPASLEYRPRLIPHSMVIRMPPPVPAIVAGGSNAIEMIIPKLLPILSMLTMMISPADIT